MSESGNPMTEREDRLQAEVIHHLLVVHPVPLTLVDLFRELGHPLYKTERDDIEIAVRELGKLELVEEDGERIRPSRGAVRYYELSEHMG